MRPEEIRSRTDAAAAAFGRGEFEDALRIVAPAADTGAGEALHVAGACLSYLGRHAAAATALRAALERDPANARIEYNLAFAELAAGDWEAGFRHFEARWRVNGRPPWVRNWDAKWNGESLDGKTLLVHAEQGLGDTMQFARYLPELRRRGARLVVGAHPQLTGVLRKIEPEALVLTTGDAVPPWDLHISTMSLPGVLRVRPDDVVTDRPYVPLAPRERRGRASRIGIVWSGLRNSANNLRKALPQDTLQELVAILDGYDVVSLQVEGEDDLSGVEGGPRVGRVGAGLKSFDDTLSALGELDLLITVDTAAAHLAGAAALPTWLLLSAIPDWRWLQSGEASIWYPSMRLFRQERLGDWSSVLGRVARDLSRRA